MITLKQILRYKLDHKIARITITRGNKVKLYYSDCHSCYVSISKFIEMVLNDY